MSGSWVWLLVLISPLIALAVGAVADRQPDGVFTWQVLLSAMSVIHAMLFLPVLSGIFVIGLAVVFSALFLGLFLAIGAGLAVRAWLRGRSHRSAPPGVIDAEYTVIESDDPPGRRGRP